LYLVPKLQLGNAYYQTTISTPSKTTSNPVKTPTPHIIFVGAPIVLDPPTKIN
jgi:hypothetical protein